MIARLLVTGPRDYTDPDPIVSAITAHVGPGQTPTLVVGDCPGGVDHAIAQWARAAGWPVEVHRADWDHCVPTCPPYPHRETKPPGDIFHPGLRPDYCPGAGPRRNGHAVAAGADLCIALVAPCTRPRCRRPEPHGTHGTADCIRQARRAGIPVHPVEPASNALF